MNVIEIVVPAGVYPGNQLLVTNPHTQQQFQVTVPQGIAPGMTFQVQLLSGSSPDLQAMAKQQAKSLLLAGGVGILVLLLIGVVVIVVMTTTSSRRQLR